MRIETRLIRTPVGLRPDAPAPTTIEQTREYARLDREAQLAESMLDKLDDQFHLYRWADQSTGAGGSVRDFNSEVGVIATSRRDESGKDIVLTLNTREGEQALRLSAHGERVRRNVLEGDEVISRDVSCQSDIDYKVTQDGLALTWSRSMEDADAPQKNFTHSASLVETEDGLLFVREREDNGLELRYQAQDWDQPWYLSEQEESSGRSLFGTLDL